jgi:hypothetical protein
VQLPLRRKYKRANHLQTIFKCVTNWHNNSKFEVVGKFVPKSPAVGNHLRLSRTRREVLDKVARATLCQTCRENLMARKKERTRWKRSFVFLGGATLLLLLWLDPFAPRYGGRTVNQWLAAEANVPMAVVNEAGASVVPKLLEAARNARRTAWIASSGFAPTALSDPYTKKGHKAESWLILMDMSGHDPLPQLEKAKDSSLIDLIKKNRKAPGDWTSP